MARRHLSALPELSGRRRRAFGRALVLGLLTASALTSVTTSDAAQAADAPPLPALCIDPAAISVSGISSGGYMANQFHVAHSARLGGAAIFGGGPYLCAGNDYPQNLFRALSVCSDFGPGPFLGPPDTQRSISAAKAAARDGAIDDPAGLRADRVFLFSGTRDTFVPRPVMDALAGFYRAFVPEAQIAYVTDVPAGHGMITTSYGGGCDVQAAPFVNHCGYDLAGAALQHIYGALAPPTAATGRLLAFDQSPFVAGQATHGLAARGYVYVPTGCGPSDRCRLHIAFHGCLQNEEAVGDAFYRHAGYNEWAEANDIVVVYPQAAAVVKRVAGMGVDWPNPQGCWDWWGFTGADFARKTGVQISAIAAMIDRIAGPAPAPEAAQSSPACPRAGSG